jgi:HAD superfamily phosphatase (TIGR01668 family)
MIYPSEQLPLWICTLKHKTMTPFERRKFRKSEIRGWLRAFCPDETVESVTDITPEYLQSHGIRAILLDLDNTITPWKSYEVSESIRSWLVQLKAAGIGLCFVSNTRRLRRLRHLSEELQVPYVLGPMKPRRTILKKALELLGVPRSEAAIVGDQMFTDIWGGNRLGIYTIWVRPLHPHEFIGTKVSRLAEGWVSRRLKRYRE